MHLCFKIQSMGVRALVSLRKNRVSIWYAFLLRNCKITMYGAYPNKQWYNTVFWRHQPMSMNSIAGFSATLCFWIRKSKKFVNTRNSLVTAMENNAYKLPWIRKTWGSLLHHLDLVESQHTKNKESTTLILKPQKYRSQNSWLFKNFLESTVKVL